ncbi:PIN domain-containing protein [Mesorhizobium sp. M1169]|uniref:PIN domain-containing protein n=1 Tax=Mesorhizobium sp. M1169 TaxID=2957066 RepID=UPI00333A2C6C
MTLWLLVDTSVWLDLAKDWRQQPVIRAMRESARHPGLELIVPDIVRDEFSRNKERVAGDARRSLQSHFRLVREAVDKFGNDATKAGTLKNLSEVDHKIVVTNGAVTESVQWIETLLAGGRRMRITNAIKQRVAERALAAVAPYHRQRNSAGDAAILECFAQVVRNGGQYDTFHFVTHNTKDFSEEAGDRRRPHLDLAPIFDGKRSVYWTSLVDALNGFEPGLLEEIDAEFNWTDTPRGLSEILEAERLMERQVWYNRHQNLRIGIERGTEKIVTNEEWSVAEPSDRHNMITAGTWRIAQDSARRTEKEIGTDKLGPWTNFEWGMLNGKLSALRWVMGDEWDMLDT